MRAFRNLIAALLVALGWLIVGIYIYGAKPLKGAEAPCAAVPYTIGTRPACVVVSP